MAWGGAKSWTRTDKMVQPDTELNRIEGNTQSIVADMSHVTNWSGLTFKTDRVETDAITASEIQHIDDNCKALMAVLGHGFLAKTFSAGSAVDFTDVNRWESCLLLCHTLALLLPQQFKYCGTFNCGEDGDIY